MKTTLVIRSREGKFMSLIPLRGRIAGRDLEDLKARVDKKGYVGHFECVHEATVEQARDRIEHLPEKMPDGVKCMWPARGRKEKGEKAGQDRRSPESPLPGHGGEPA